jgi:Allene oxide cyclase barrel like domain
MKRLAICLGVACAALVTAIAVVGTSGAKQAGPPTGTLDLVLRQGDAKFKAVDNPPLRKESAGDMAIITGRLRGSDGTAQGRLQVYFVATKSGNFDRAFRGQVSGSFVLPAGDIVAEGVTDDARDQEPLAIVGGTGSYAGARGVLVVTDTRTETRFRFTFQP